MDWRSRKTYALIQNKVAVEDFIHNYNRSKWYLPRTSKYFFNKTFRFIRLMSERVNDSPRNKTSQSNLLSAMDLQFGHISHYLVNAH